MLEDLTIVIRCGDNSASYERKVDVDRINLNELISYITAEINWFISVSETAEPGQKLR